VTRWCQPRNVCLLTNSLPNTQFGSAVRIRSNSSSEMSDSNSNIVLQLAGAS
jgi:hypothetical protein